MGSEVERNTSSEGVPLKARFEVDPSKFMPDRVLQWLADVREAHPDYAEITMRNLHNAFDESVRKSSKGTYSSAVQTIVNCIPKDLRDR